MKTYNEYLESLRKRDPELAKTFEAFDESIRIRVNQCLDGISRKFDQIDERLKEAKPKGSG